jgi:metallo-beta-lactamase family protein
LKYPKVLHHGGIRGVTGSCHELRVDRDNGILVDCGLFQGEERSRGGANAQLLQIDFPIDHIQALVLTHVHIDHVGRLPYLMAAGFKGPIICSEPSALLLPLVLHDAVAIGFQPRLAKRFVDYVKNYVVALPYREWHEIKLVGGNSSLKVRLQRAGHILGSAYVECEASAQKQSDKTRTVFSGDLGAPYTPLLPTFKAPYQADVVVLESTYGDRLHERRKERRQKLKEIIHRALQDRGVILIPAFSIGRTQELLYELEDIIHRSKRKKILADLAWDDLEIIVDSPLAAKFTEVYRTLKPFWDTEARQHLREGRHPLTFEQLTTIDRHKDHVAAVKYLKRTARPCVVIAASGMCSGGRIMNYLKALIGDARTDVLFVGYQAKGTPGSNIQKYGPRGGYVELDRRRYEIKAQIHTIHGYSAHGDQKDLLNFVTRMHHRPREIRLVHGDRRAKLELKNRLLKRVPGVRVVVPA